ncbi:hypothetical protein DFH08DRAFT_818539 [Mycena albidolilacea]|uniref:Uncharacterized protein n=1 Tax=Mycena albidolilacea TaxID=1033008 RepID=A0AAD6ZH95_9AGAR|nr:hypothetical protein DFH08DRAFT_818539 [Mycena albidolilacea]
MGKKVSIKYSKKGSPAQQAQSKAMHTGNKENVQPLLLTLVTAKTPRKARDYKKDYQNLQQKHWHLVLDSYKSRVSDNVLAMDLAKHREAESQCRRAAMQGVINKVLSKGAKEARKLARIMVDAGCTHGKVGSLMEQVGDIFRVHINWSMSRCTIIQAIGEGGVTAKMQITYELGLNKGVSISADSTANQGINIESGHIAHRVPDYKSGNLDIDPSLTPCIHFLGIEKTIDHTSIESVKVWQPRIQASMDLFNASPLAKCLQKNYTF